MAKCLDPDTLVESRVEPSSPGPALLTVATWAVFSAQTCFFSSVFVPVVVKQANI